MFWRAVLPTSLGATALSVTYFASKSSLFSEKRTSFKEEDNVNAFEKLSLKEVYSRYKIKTLDNEKGKNNVLGEGSYAHVIGCTETNTGKNVALKVVRKAYTRPQVFEREVSALSSARFHPNIVQMIDVVDVPDGECWLLITELLEGGELFDRILHKGSYSEHSAAVLIKKVASAIQCLHRLGWTHNDVKPENLMYVDKSDDSEIKLIDFGMARRHSDGVVEKVALKDLGTTAYWSPELLDPTTRFTSDPRAIDAWTIGVLAYILLFGCHPFDRTGDASEDEVARRIGLGASGKSPYISFDCYGEKLRISDLSKDFLKKLLDSKLDQVFCLELE